MRTSQLSAMTSTGVLLLALVGMLLTGCGVTSATQRTSATAVPPTPTTVPTPAPTLTPAPAHQLQWQARTLPAPYIQPYGVSLGFSPLDNSLVWACAPSQSAAHIWLSHDRAATWRQMTDVPASGEVDVCSITPDDLDPTTAVVQTDLVDKGCCVLPPMPYPMRITRDGGHSWSIFKGPDDTLRQIATFHDITYALFTKPVADMAPFTSDFVASRDGLHTWQTMDGSLSTPGSSPITSGYVREFWVNPATGALLAHTSTSVVWSDHFFTSTNGGAPWHDLHAPQADDFVIRRPFAAGLWEICGVRRSNSSDHPAWNNTMPCTMDSGSTWTTRTITPIRSAFAIANDGSVLGLTDSSLMRLTPAGKDWESLGPLNTIYLPPYAYVAGSGTGILWNLPDTNEKNQTTVYVASYA